MPRQDGTGPTGSGPRDGRGQGVGGKKVRGAREKVKEPRVEAKKADASRRRDATAFHLQMVQRPNSLAVMSASR